MSMPSVIASIVIYKHTATNLMPTITSLKNQKNLKKIIIIDNDESTWANKLHDEKIIYIKSQKNIGYGRANNIAIHRYAAECDYFLICNPDVEFPSNTLTNILSASKIYKAGLYMPKIVFPDGSNQELCKLLPTPADLFARRFLPWLKKWTEDRYLLRQADINKPFLIPSLSGCFMLCKSDKLLEIGGFDERYFMYMEDVDLSRRFAISYGCYYLPVATVTHSFRRESYSNKKLLFAHIISVIKYFNKWGWFFDKERTKINKTCLEQLPHKH